jgi:hypothetical protein
MKLSIGARAQAFVLLALVATAGALAGMVGQRAFGQHTLGEPRDSAVQDGSRAPAAEGRYAARLTGSLELTPAQEDAIDEIVAEEQARVRETDGRGAASVPCNYRRDEGPHRERAHARAARPAAGAARAARARHGRHGRPRGPRRAGAALAARRTRRDAPLRRMQPPAGRDSIVHERRLEWIRARDSILRETRDSLVRERGSVPPERMDSIMRDRRERMRQRFDSLRTRSRTHPFLRGTEMTMASDDNDGAPLDPRVRIGHVHLKVADLDRSLDFYCGVLGFELMQRYGPGAAFVAAGGYHHHIGLNTWESSGGAHRRAARPVSTTSPSSTLTARPSPTRCAACWTRASPSTAPAITA